MKTLSIANESIAFQSKSFFRSLVAAIKNYHDNENSGSTMLGKEAVERLLTNISMTISDHTNIRNSVHFIPEYDNAACIYPIINTEHVFNTDDIKPERIKKMIQNRVRDVIGEVIDGWIDPVSARVGGDFSRILHKVVIGSVLLDKKKFTPEQSAAIIIHEVGHAYTFLQSIADSAATNFVLSIAAREFTQEPDFKKARIILDSVAAAVGDADRTWTSEITESQERTVSARVFLAHVARVRNSGDNKMFYNYNNAEQAADIFVVRHGAGEAMMEARHALTKLPDYGKSPSYMRCSNLFGPILTIIASGILVAGGVSIGMAESVVAGVGLGYYGVTNLIATLVKMYDMKDPQQFDAEISKLRNQMIAGLKDKDITPDTRKELLKGIERGTALLQAQVKKIETPFMHVMFDLIHSSRVDQRRSREYTDVLENMVANNLFVKANSLIA